MNYTEMAINIIAGAIYSFGGLLFWFNRQNLASWMSAPAYVVGYFIPALAVDYLDKYSPATISLFTQLNALGGLGMVAGLVLGWAVEASQRRLGAYRVSTRRFDYAHIERRVTTLLLACNLLLTLCFLWMGFLPIFADSPFQAKFFKGEYHDKYAQVAIFYRLAQSALIAVMPIAVVFWAKRRNKFLGIYLLWTVALFTVALTRSTALGGVLLVIAVWCTRSRLLMLGYLLSVVLVYCIGSIVYLFLGIFEAGSGGIWVEIARGSPDISDQLQFLSKFDLGKNITYGLTFIGGLVPGNFYFNPSAFTLFIANDTTDISELGSGGFRMTPALHGYIAMGWIGAFIVPLISGFLWYFGTQKLRDAMKGDLVAKVLAVQYYFVVSAFLIFFYNLSYVGVVSVASVWYAVNGFPSLKRLMYGRRRQKNNAQDSHRPQVKNPRV